MLNQLKLKKIHLVVCNSQFTKRFIDQEFGVNSAVLYPPIATDQFTPGRKQNLIISVGRFSQLLQHKRQDILISAFKKLHAAGYNNWELILAGGSEIGRTEAVDKLYHLAKGFPISIIENPNFKNLQLLYARAKLFWFASGFEVNESDYPTQVEHFGVSVAEAMSAGAVPLVHPKGGVTEVVNEGKNGLYWHTHDGLVTQTINLIESPTQLVHLSAAAVIRAQDFSAANFAKTATKLIS